MPVSHLGLTVSHIPSATSFYLSALQPLGYRYIGQQGDSIGLGVESADFFITQAPNNSRASPTHIAFSAASRLIVRECYTAALNAGGRPSGAPSYRNDDCTCFNAAVEDLFGNTIEFIYRQPHLSAAHDTATPSEHNNGRLQGAEPQANPDGGDDDDGDDVHTVNSRSSKISKSTKKSEAPSQETASSKGSVSNTLIGAALGAAAGAAIVYAMCKEERKNARDELEYIASEQSPDSYRSIEDKRPPSPTAETLPASKSEKMGRKSHRNFSTTESTYVSRRPSLHPGMRAIEPAPYDQDPILESISRYNAQQRPELMRRQTYDAIEYVPIPKVSADSQFSMKRAVTLPVNVDVPDYYIEAPESTTSSRHSASSRRSHRSHRSRRNSLGSESKLRRHDSGISVHSSRSTRDHGSDSGHRSSASTIKPSRQESVVKDHISTHSRSIPYDHVSTHSKSIAHEQASTQSRGIPYDQVSTRSKTIPHEQASTHSRAVPYDQVSTNSKSVPREQASTHSRGIVYEQISTHSRNDPQDSTSTHSRNSHHDRASTHSRSIPHDRASTHSRSVPPDHVSALSKSAPPSRRLESYYESAAGIPLPPSVAASGYSGSLAQRRTSSQYESAVEVPMPASKATSYVSAAQVPLPASNADFAWEDIIGEESDGLGDTRTVVPEDSISCVDFSKSSRREGSSRSGHKTRSSHHSSRRSDTSERTVRPAKKSGSSRHSAMTLPARSKREEREDGKRSAVSYS